MDNQKKKKKKKNDIKLIKWWAIIIYYLVSSSSLKHLKLLESEVAQSCLTLCYPVEYNPPGSSVHEILQARILEWVAIPFSRGSSQLRDWTQVSHNAGDSLPAGPQGKPMC